MTKEKSTPHLLYEELMATKPSTPFTSRDYCYLVPDKNENIISAAFSLLEKEGVIKAVGKRKYSLLYVFVGPIRDDYVFKASSRGGTRNRNPGYEAGARTYEDLGIERPKKVILPKSLADQLLAIAVKVENLESQNKSLENYSTEELYAELRRRNAHLTGVA